MGHLVTSIYPCKCCTHWGAYRYLIYERLQSFFFFKPNLESWMHTFYALTLKKKAILCFLATSSISWSKCENFLLLILFTNSYVPKACFPFTYHHPNYLNEYFGSRIEIGRLIRKRHTSFRVCLRHTYNLQLSFYCRDSVFYKITQFIEKSHFSRKIEKDFFPRQMPKMCVPFSLCAPQSWVTIFTSSTSTIIPVFHKQTLIDDNKKE